jgi:pSer/pThr/pTyr-binding forkhead associated (FHA) protein
MAALQDPRRSTEFPLHDRLTLVGRDRGCDIVVDSQMVSARHFIIVHAQGRYAIEDLNSMNGTFLNGHRLSGRAFLSGGDRIDLIGIGLL